jgi:hypothetical protein
MSQIEDPSVAWHCTGADDEDPLLLVAMHLLLVTIIFRELRHPSYHKRLFREVLSGLHIFGFMSELHLPNRTRQADE